MLETAATILITIACSLALCSFYDSCDTLSEFLVFPAMIVFLYCAFVNHPLSGKNYKSTLKEIAVESYKEIKQIEKEVKNEK